MNISLIDFASEPKTDASEFRFIDIDELVGEDLPAFHPRSREIGMIV